MLRAPLVPRLLVAAVITRGPIGVVGLAIVLVVRDASASYAAAGAVAAAFAVGVAAIAPLLGRLVDRLGARPVLLPLAAAHAVALLLLVALAEARSPVTVLGLVAFAGGVTVTPVGSVMRALWPELVAPELLTTAYALDSVSVELVFMVGPLLVAAATAAGEPGIALVVAAALVLGGTLAFTTCEPVRNYAPASHERATGGRLGALRSAGVRTVVLSSIPIGFCLGAAEVAFPAFGESIGEAALAGPLIALWSLGSAAGGIAYGAHGHRLSAAAAYTLGAAALPLATLPLALAGSFGAMIPLALLAGLAVAPLLAAANQVIGQVAPRGALTEAFTWPITALVAGVSAGNAAAGAAIQAEDWRAAFVVAAAVGMLGFLALVARRAPLAPATA